MVKKRAKAGVFHGETKRVPSGGVCACGGDLAAGLEPVTEVRPDDGWKTKRALKDAFVLVAGTWRQDSNPRQSSAPKTAAKRNAP
jgi:hypothetical protein